MKKMVVLVLFIVLLSCFVSAKYAKFKGSWEENKTLYSKKWYSLDNDTLYGKDVYPKWGSNYNIRYKVCETVNKTKRVRVCENNTEYFREVTRKRCYRNSSLGSTVCEEKVRIDREFHIRSAVGVVFEGSDGENPLIEDLIGSDLHEAGAAHEIRFFIKGFRLDAVVSEIHEGNGYGPIPYRAIRSLPDLHDIRPGRLLQRSPVNLIVDLSPVAEFDQRASIGTVIAIYL